MEIFRDPLIILGGGFTGKMIYRQGLGLGRPIYITSRNPKLHLHSFPEKSRIWFDLEIEKSWENLPKKADIIWTFPPCPLEKVKGFISKKESVFHRAVVIGSTSVYQFEPSIEPVNIDENTSVNGFDSRVEGEKFLQKSLGAVVLRSAGIYGPGRNPLNWIRTGRLKNFSKPLNLIHVEDLASICLIALEKGIPAETYNISDGSPTQISELITLAGKRWNIPKPTYSKDDLRPKKMISNQKMILHFNYKLKYPVLYDALDKLEEQHFMDSLDQNSIF